jgi:hypothetical protein
MTLWDADQTPQFSLKPPPPASVYGKLGASLRKAKALRRVRL